MTATYDHLNRRRRRELRSLLTIAEVPAGVELTREGQHGQCFMFLIGGTAEVFVGGRSQGVKQAGDFFGELALLPKIAASDGRRTATVLTTERSVLGVCGRSEFDDLLRRFPVVGGAILAQAYRLSEPGGLWTGDAPPERPRSSASWAFAAGNRAITAATSL